ncbi:MAG: hypothetical protein ACLFU7_11360 [Armatimonadota bacterium]
MPKVIHARGSLTIAKYTAAVLVIATLSALQAPYQYGNGNQVFQIPSVHKAIEPGLYPDDALVESLENYPSVAYPALARIAETLNIGVEPLYFSVWALQRVALVALFMAIASRSVDGLPGRVFVTLVACTSHWAIMPTLVGGEHIFSSRLTHTDLAFVLHLAALAAWLHRRPILAGVGVGTAVYLNVMTTSHFVGFLVLLLVLSGKWRSRDGHRAVLTAALIAAPFAIFAVGPVVSGAAPAEPTELYWQLQFALPNHHFLMDEWALPFLLSLGLALGLAAVVGRLEAPLRHIATAGTLYLGAMYVVSLFGAHLFPSRLVLMFHPLRGDRMLLLALVIVLPIFIWQRVSGNALPRPALFVLPVLAAVFMVGARPPVIALMALPLLVALHLLLSGGPPSERRVRATALVGAGLTAGPLAVFGVPHATTAAVALSIGVLGSWGGLYSRRWAPIAIAVVVAISAGLAVRAVGLSTGEFAWYRAGSDRAFDDVARWADANTDLQARFITPPGNEGWRSLSRRSTLVQYRDGSAMDWYPGFEPGQRDRLAALDCHLMPNHPDLHGELCRRYLRLTPRRLLAAAEEYAIDYVVMPAEWPHGEGLTPVYANEGYEVFSSTELQRAAAIERGED